MNPAIESDQSTIKVIVVTHKLSVLSGGHCKGCDGHRSQHKSSWPPTMLCSPSLWALSQQKFGGEWRDSKLRVEWGPLSQHPVT